MAQGGATGPHSAAEAHARAPKQTARCACRRCSHGASPCADDAAQEREDDMCAVFFAVAATSRSTRAATAPGARFGAKAKSLCLREVGESPTHESTDQ